MLSTFVCLLFVSACASEPGADKLLATDTAGIEIVTNARLAGAAIAVWTLSPEPEIRVETPESGDVVLFEVSTVSPLSNGRIGVGNGNPVEVLIFDESGALTQRLGGEGDGPGEFRAIQSVVEIGPDSVGVYDPIRKHVSVFSPDGELARFESLTHVAPASGWSRLLPIGTDEFILFGEASFGDVREPGRFRREESTYRLGPDGSTLADYGTFPGLMMVVSEMGAGVLLFGPRSFAAVSGSTLIVGTAEQPEFRAYSSTGDLVRIVRWPDHVRQVTPERVAQFIEAGLADMPEQQRAAMRKLGEALPFAEEEPPYEDIIASDVGDLWVGSYQGPEVALPSFRPPRRSWLIFDSDGALEATLETGAGFHPHAVWNGVMLGVFFDESGVESIHGYAISAS